jgi:hypothetical protein
LHDWFKSHDVLTWWLFAASVAMFVLTPAVITWFVIRMPADYFAAIRRRESSWWQRHPLLRPAVIVLKNLTGIVLVLAGLVMLVVPGQGALSIAVGVTLIDFPGKYRFERWLATRPPVWRAIQWLRKCARREPLQRPG